MCRNCVYICVLPFHVGEEVTNNQKTKEIKNFEKRKRKRVRENIGRE